MTFKNKRYFQKQSFELLEKTLKIHKKGFLDESEYEIPLEQINNKKTVQTEVNNNLIFIGIFFFAFSFLFLLGTTEQLTFIFGAIGLIFIVIALINRKKTVSISTYSSIPIILYFNSSNKEDVISYSNTVIAASNKYLFRKYGKIDRTLPIEPQIENLKFLLDRDIISENNFEVLKNQLLGREGRSSIGFSN